MKFNLFGKRPVSTDAETLEAIEEVDRKIRSGYDPREDPSSPYHLSKNPKPTGIQYGNTQYALVETIPYLKGRVRMEERGYDLSKLDYVISILLNGDALPRRFKPHRLKGDGSGLMECHPDGNPKGDWVLIYRYDDSKLVLYAIKTGTHRDCGVD